MTWTVLFAELLLALGRALGITAQALVNAAERKAGAAEQKLRDMTDDEARVVAAINADLGVLPVEPDALDRDRQK